MRLYKSKMRKMFPTKQIKEHIVIKNKNLCINISFIYIFYFQELIKKYFNKKGLFILNNILKNTYKMKDFSFTNLKELGFYYNTVMSDEDRKCFSIRFPVVKYNSHASIIGEITVNSVNGKVYINVYNMKGSHYIPFYNHEYGNFDDILKIINKNLLKQMKKYKIKRILGE